MNNNIKFFAPDVTATIKYAENVFVVGGWMKDADDDNYMWCDRKSAKYVVCISQDRTMGVVLPITKCKVVGRIASSKRDYEAAKKSAIRQIGQKYPKSGTTTN